MTEEKLNIQISEEPDGAVSVIKEQQYQIALIATNESRLTTEAINGFFESLYINTNSLVGIKIYSERIPELILFEDVSFSGQKYLPIRQSAISSNGELFNYSQEKIALNEALVIEIKGPVGAETHLIMRWC